jgi:tetratricopeptide (TPR) repeat protein
MFNGKGKAFLIRKAAAAETAMKRKNFKKAVGLYDAVLGHESYNELDNEMKASVLLNKGHCFVSLGLPREGIRFFILSSELNPSSYKPYLNTALAFARNLNQYDLSIGYFDKALERNPSCVDALTSRAMAKILTEDPEGGKEDLEAALAIAPKDVNALCNMGNLYASKGNFEKASQYYQDALNNNPGDYEVRCNLGMAMYNIGLRNAAENILKQDNRALQLFRSKGGRL